RRTQRVDHVRPQAEEQRRGGDDDPEEPLLDVQVVAADEIKDPDREDQPHHDDGEVVALHRARARGLQRARHSSVVSAMYQPTVHHEKKMREAPLLRGFMSTETSAIFSPARRRRRSTPMSW